VNVLSLVLCRRRFNTPATRQDVARELPKRLAQGRAQLRAGREELAALLPGREGADAQELRGGLGCARGAWV